MIRVSQAAVGDVGLADEVQDAVGQGGLAVAGEGVDHVGGLGGDVLHRGGHEALAVEVGLLVGVGLVIQIPDDEGAVHGAHHGDDGELAGVGVLHHHHVLAALVGVQHGGIGDGVDVVHVEVIVELRVAGDELGDPGVDVLLHGDEDEVHVLVHGLRPVAGDLGDLVDGLVGDVQIEDAGIHGAQRQVQKDHQDDGKGDHPGGGGAVAAAVGMQDPADALADLLQERSEAGGLLFVVVHGVSLLSSSGVSGRSARS